jgi:hypothetical protein
MRGAWRDALAGFATARTQIEAAARRSESRTIERRIGATSGREATRKG